ncbi:MAG: alkaline phosphatase [Christensenellales bacterium]
MKKLTALLLAALMLLSLGTALAGENETVRAKYVFFFIGDGMGAPQTTATRYYLGTRDNPDSAYPVPGKLSFDNFEAMGLMTTYDATSFAPDSASTASSMASGAKTLSGVINYDVKKETTFKLVSEYAKEAGMKVGVASSVSLDHATPAAFYAKVPSRGQYYDISVQGLTGTILDFLGGGGFKRPNGEKDNPSKNLYELATESGWNYINTNEGIRAISADSGRTLAIVPDIADSDAMHYEIDRLAKVEAGEESLSLADITAAAIRNLDNENGFFLMVEGGKIDWTCHANDATTAIYDTLALDAAVQEAVKFAENHPEETLIVVTGDHETGGLTIGFATTAYDTHFQYLQNQKISFTQFGAQVDKMREDKVSFEDAMAIVAENFGLTLEEGKELTLNAAEAKALKNAFELSMLPRQQRTIGAEEAFLYGGYEPFTMAITHCLNNKAGLAYTSYAHTGMMIPVYANGAGARHFVGSYDNTDIFHGFMQAMGLEIDTEIPALAAAK